ETFALGSIGFQKRCLIWLVTQSARLIAPIGAATSRVSMLREPSKRTATSGRLDLRETCTHSGRNSVKARSEIRTNRRTSRRSTAGRMSERSQFDRQTQADTTQSAIAPSHVDHDAANDQWLMMQQ